jgi:spore germination protein YaaH
MMFKKIISLLTVCLVILGVMVPAGNVRAAGNTKISMVWHYPSLAPLSDAKNLDIVSTNWFSLNEDLTITDQGEKYSTTSPYYSYSYIAYAHSQGMKVIPRLESPMYSGWPAVNILSDPAKRKTIIDNITALIAKYKAKGTPIDGINLDFEAMGSAATTYYVQFVKECSAAVKAQGIYFSIDVPGKTDYTSESSIWTGGYDFASLNQISQIDHIVVMAYDWMYGAPKNYERDAVNYALKYFPSSKILLGVPLYSMDYIVTVDGTLTLWDKLYYTDAIAKLNLTGSQMTWDSTLGLNKITYTQPDANKQPVQHVLYLEDRDSLNVKLDMMNEFNLAGMAAWSYYKVDQRIWQAIGEKTGKVSPILNSTGILNFKNNGAAYEPTLAWYSSPFSFPWNNAKGVSGDFTGDGKSDIAVLYNYGNSTTGLWVFSPNGTTYTPNLFWKSGQGGFSWDRSKLVSGDFNGDGKSDVGILYDYGSNTSGLWVFQSNGNSFTPKLGWISAPGSFSWNNTKLTAGDYDKDGAAEFAALYDYGFSTTGIWEFKSDGTQFLPKLAWISGSGGFDWRRSKISSADYSGDGKADVAVLYDYGNDTSGIWSFVSDGLHFSPQLTWQSGTSNFSWARATMASGDFDGKGYADLAFMYNYGNGTTGMFNFKSNKTGFQPAKTWMSGSGGMSADRSQFSTGDFDGDGKADYEIIYNYAQ